ncbi:MAG: hypothetical protein ABIQ60_05020 [Burkholderiaceae bacterium]
MGHLQIHHDDVGLRLQRDLDRLGAVGGLSDDGDAGLFRQHHRDAATYQRLIVDDQQSQASILILDCHNLHMCTSSANPALPASVHSDHDLHGPGGVCR